MNRIFLSAALAIAFSVPAISSKPPVDEDKLYPARQTIINACDKTTRTNHGKKGGLRKEQGKAINGVLNLYLNGLITKEQFFVCVDDLVTNRTILGRHAAKIKELVNEKKRPNFSIAKRGEAGHEKMKSAYRIISKQNKAIFNRGYRTSNGQMVSPVDLQLSSSCADSWKYALRNVPSLIPGTEHTVIQVQDQDTIHGAQDLINAGCLKVAMLNFANRHSPGGGYVNGANAQEEDLCRRTTLYPVLDNLRNKGQYRIHHEELIYTPNVKIFRESHHHNFKLLDHPTSVQVLTQAAYNQKRGGKHADCVSAREFETGTLNKIRLQLRVAKQNGCDAIVLGAFGCGAFRNNPEVVSNLYVQVLNEAEFANQFRFIRFAIPGGDNLNVFRRNLAPLIGQ